VSIAGMITWGSCSTQRKSFPCSTLSDKSDVDCFGIEPGPLQWETSSLVHEPWHGPVSLERYANRAAYYKWMGSCSHVYMAE